VVSFLTCSMEVTHVINAQTYPTKSTIIESLLPLTCIISCFFFSCKSQRLINVRSVSEDVGEIFLFCENNINKIKPGSTFDKGFMNWTQMLKVSPKQSRDSLIKKWMLWRMTSRHACSIHLQILNAYKSLHPFFNTISP